MKKELYHIWPEDESVTLTVFGADPMKQGRAALIVVPGGAYIAPAAREADPVAMHFAEKDYLGCVLRASTMYRDHTHMESEPNPHTRFPEPLQEMAAAIAFLRERAEEFGIDPTRIALMGFSAGGHLVANYGNYWRDEQQIPWAASSREAIRPNASVLCYAAVRPVRVRESAMLKAVFGGTDWTDEQVDVYDGAGHVNEYTPPTFLWHTADDAMVSVEQCYDMTDALKKHKIAYEVHIFSSGPHASGLAGGLPAESWTELADSFLKRILA